LSGLLRFLAVHLCCNGHFVDVLRHELIENITEHTLKCIYISVEKKLSNLFSEGTHTNK
jgi:hypothetical protein